MDIIDQILACPLLSAAPPVLVDIGASGEINPKWKAIAKYSICIAFDADDREIGYAVNESSEYRKLYVFNSLVSDRESAGADFYLTSSPYCSSLLEPDHQSLDKWNFGDLFHVNNIAKMKTVTLPTALREIGVSKIDWFKTDSQGTDLRLFSSLGEEGMRKTLMAEFEPGIIDGYKGEDKLHMLMSFMDKRPFWMNDIKICGTQRLSQEAIYKQFPGYNGKQAHGLPFRISPCWAEVSYFNQFGIEALYLDLRDFLLGWVFAVIDGQHGFALDIALQGKQRFNETFFDMLVQYSTAEVARNP